MTVNAKDRAELGDLIMDVITAAREAERAWHDRPDEWGAADIRSQHRQGAMWAKFYALLGSEDLG